MQDLNIKLSTQDYAYNGTGISTGITVKQNDFGTYTLVFAGMDLTEADGAIIRFVLPDSGKTVVIDTAEIHSNTIRYALKNGIISHSGSVHGEISLYDGESRITTNTFAFTVVADIPSDGIEADNRFPVLDEKIIEVDALQATAEDQIEQIQELFAVADDVADNMQIVTDAKDVVLGAAATVNQQAGEVADRAAQVALDALQVREDKTTVSADKTDVIQKANVVSLNKEATDANVELTEDNVCLANAARDNAIAAKNETLATEQRVISLMSTDTKSHLFATIAERDAFEVTGTLRHCDRCSVIETRTDYIYDAHDTNDDGINPEWIPTSSWDALKTVAWEIISGKPNFSTVAFSGLYADLIGKPNRYEQFETVSVGWDYANSDKVIVTAPYNIEQIYNVTNGSIGLALSDSDLALPQNSKFSKDFNYMTKAAGALWQYTFLYDGSFYYWSRTVMA